MRYFEKSLKIRKNSHNKISPDIVESYINIGNMYILLKKYSHALKYLEESLTIIKGEHRYLHNIYNSLATLYQKKKDFFKALNYYKNALVIREKILGKEHPTTATSYNNIGTLYKSMGDYSKAYLYAKKSFNAFIINRDKNFEILDTAQKEIYLKSNSNQVPLLLSTAHLYREHNVNKSEQVNVAQESLNSWLSYKGSILDSENIITTLYENTKDQALKTKIDELRLNQRAYAKLLQSTAQSDQEVKTYKQRVKEAEDKINTLTSAIAEKAQSFKEEQGLKTISYKDISANLNKEELYIDYAKAGEHYYLFTLDKKEKLTFTQIDANSTKKIDTLVQTFRKDIQTILSGLGTLTPENLKQLNRSSKETLGQLYQLLVTQPLLKVVKDKTNLIISPDGALKLLPFEALYDTKRQKYFLEEKTMYYIPSGKEKVRLDLYTSKTKSKQKQLIVFDDPDYDMFDIKVPQAKQEQNIAKNDTVEILSPTRSAQMRSLSSLPYFDPLPGSKEEARVIKSLYKEVKEYKRQEASETNLLTLKQPHILHLSTHGFFVNDPTVQNPMLKSGLIFAGANRSRRVQSNEGIVTALKLSGLNLKGTDLVVLSACETGVVDINSTDSVSGLAKAFIQAGAKNVLMTLWSVADKESAALISDFYKKTVTDENYAKSLREAKLKMIEESKHPFFWAGFVLSGE